jgi:hypothetical protein
MTDKANPNHDLPPETEAEKNARLLREDETRKLQHRKDLGANGKLWTIEIEFMEGRNSRRFMTPNFTWGEVLEFRETVYTRGGFYQVDPGRWRVVAPMCIVDVYCQRQKKFID